MSASGGQKPQTVEKKSQGEGEGGSRDESAACLACDAREEKRGSDSKPTGLVLRGGVSDSKESNLEKACCCEKSSKLGSTNFGRKREAVERGGTDTSVG